MTDTPRHAANRGVSPSPDTTSTTLLERVVAQQPEAWQRLVDLYGPLLYRWCQRCGLTVADAADIAQEVFSTVADRVGEFSRQNGAGSFRSWLRTITRNKIGDWLRRRQRSSPAPGGTDAWERLQTIPESLTSASAQEEADEAQIVLRQAMAAVEAEFEPLTWRAFWMITVDGRAPVDVAADLGLTLQAAYKAKSRVLARLRRELAHESAELRGGRPE